ncbi:energy transducer TonB [Flavobacterium alvei]|uniref:energy transducer TonB n=1 Tax=Flavobacterium alvei TaxID=2080416 RepID=UPI00350E52F5
MKKLSLLFVILFISFSFGQTKKKEPIVKQSDNEEVMRNTIKGNPDSEDDVSTVVVNQDDNLIYNTAGIEVKPEFPGGPTKMYEFIEKNFIKPQGEVIKGKVYVTFVIEKDGTLTDIKVLRDLGYGTGKEAIRVLKMMPKWSPGEQNGKKVRCIYSFPISIQ